MAEARMGKMDRLAHERRARLAAERLLQQKQRELFAANEKLALHARALSDQIIEQRHVTRAALSEAEELKGQNLRFLSDLENAHTTAVMAERRLRDSMDAISDGFAVFDTDFRLVVANRAYLSVFGDHPIGPGTPYAELLRIVARQGRVDIGTESVEEWAARMLARWENDPIPQMEVKLSDGTWLRLVDRRARDGDMVCLALDITDQMRIWAAIEALPDAFVLFDKEERLLAFNQRYAEMFPDSAGMMIPGTSFEDLLRGGLEAGHLPEAAGREEEWLQQRLTQMREARHSSTNQLADGRWILEQEHVTPDGGRVGLRMDVTAIREQQTALEEARRAAEAANRAKSAFLANMSHEIRTPMNGVVGMAELLCDSKLSEEQRLFAETIRSSGEALLAIINDILDYSKIEAQRLTLHPEPFDLERVIHEVAMLLQPRARAQGIDLIIDFDMFLPTRFVGDPGRLRQILTNLMGNAVKFTRAGHVLVRVVGIETEPGRQQLHVSVEDTGIGIPADQLDHIFGEFNQVETDANRQFEGTGLGLAITRRLIERMEGAVWVDSEPGKGSCFGFRVTLPVAEPGQLETGPIAFSRALIVDDQFINRTILERQLVTCGMKVTACRSGAEALALLERDRDFDLLLTDHEMPEMTGLALVRKVRAAGLDLPIVLLSTNPAVARAEEGAEHVATMIQKPLLRSDLYNRLQALSIPATNPADPAPPPVAATAEPEQRVMRVLAAEDNRTNQLVFRKMVKGLTIDLTFAHNGREAVEIFQTLQPDLIFMDISMPEMDGREASRAIRALEAGTARRVPIVALTAHALEGDDAGILGAGIDRYLTKPLRRNTICDTLKEFCPEGALPVTGAEETGPTD